jgi:hypothetical protein
MPKTKAETKAKSKNIKSTEPTGTSPAMRRAFLIHLAESSNVAASAKAAGASRAAMYAERRRLPAFASQWQEALIEGYTRIEADLLEEARRAPSAKTSDELIKARAQKHKLRLSLLTLHRASVKNAPASPTVADRKYSADENKALRAKMLAKLEKMRARIEHDASGNRSDLPSG